MTTDPEPIEYWEEAFRRFRGSELAELLIRLTRVALRNGTVTSEDAHSVPVTNPSVRGSAMRELARHGIIRKEEPTTGRTDQSHGHFLWRWVLASENNAKALLGAAQKAMGLGDPEKKPDFRQEELFK